MRKLFKATAGLVGIAGLTTPALAQNQAPAFIPIEDRPRPEYRTEPINVGSFELRPSINSQIEYVDNLFPAATTSVEDVVVRVTPTLRVADRRSDRQIVLNLRAGYETYLDNSIDDRLLLNAKGNVRLGLGTATRPFIGFNVSRNDTRGRDFGSFDESVQPIKLTAYRGNVGLDQDIGSFTVTAEGRYSAADFDGDIFIDNAVFDSAVRNSDQYGGRFRMAYTRDAAQTFYLEGEVNEYDFVTPDGSANFPPNFQVDRSSTETRLSAGFARNLTEVLRVDVNAGYLRQSFVDPTLDSVETISVIGRLFWNPSRLTSIQARAQRTVDPSIDPLFAGLLRTEGAFIVQHELRRNVVIGVEGQVGIVQLVDSNDDGSEIALAGMVRYFASPRFSLRLRAERFDRSGLFPGVQNRVSLATRLNF
ncbi:MAG: outer membrane beta-barrel protein [Pseudomonadota bacterium]